MYTRRLIAYRTEDSEKRFVYPIVAHPDVGLCLTPVSVTQNRIVHLNLNFLTSSPCTPCPALQPPLNPQVAYLHPMTFYLAHEHAHKTHPCHFACVQFYGRLKSFSLLVVPHCACSASCSGHVPHVVLSDTCHNPTHVQPLNARECHLITLPSTTSWLFKKLLRRFVFVLVYCQLLI